jgi:hypothetical protein
MGRVFFPTTSLNRFGVRDTNQNATLGGPARFPAEPTPRAAMTPTGPLLGALDGELGVLPLYQNGGAAYWGARPPIRIVSWNPPAPAAPTPMQAVPQAVPPAQTINSSGGGGAAPPSPAATSVSSQVGPTPTATLPAAPASNTILISSGGGTQTPATAPVAAAAPSTATGLVDGIAAWLGGTTSLMNYNVPNALLAGVVVLGFAWLSSGSSSTGGRKR